MAYNRKRSRSSMMRRRRAPQRVARKQAYRKKRSFQARRNNRMLIIPNGQPNRAYVGLTMRGYTPVNAPGASVTAAIFQATARPYRESGATQLAFEPQGFDNWRNLFATYRVMGMKVKVVFTSNGSTPLQVESYVARDMAAVSAQWVLDNKYSKISVVGSNTNKVTHSWYIRPWIIHGMTKQQWITSSTTIANTGTNVPAVAPGNATETVFLITNVRNTLATASSLYRSVFIKLYLQFEDPIFIGDVQ